MTLVRHPEPRRPRDGVGPPVQQLDQQQLLEGEPIAPRGGLGERGRPMHHAERVRQRDHTGLAKARLKRKGARQDPCETGSRRFACGIAMFSKLLQVRLHI